MEGMLGGCGWSDACNSSRMALVCFLSCLLNVYVLVKIMSAEEDRLWSIVKANSLDFDAWIALLDETEKWLGNLSACYSGANVFTCTLCIRKVYDAFLYADHEARLGFMDKVVESMNGLFLGHVLSGHLVALLHICHIHYTCNSGFSHNGERLFERGLVYVGTNYLSYPLWDKGWASERFKAFAASRPLSELKTAVEASAAAAGACTLLEDGGQAKKGEPSKPVSAGLGEAEEVEKYIVVREEIYKKAKEFDSKISDFENAIRRPYFHVRPLNVTEIENWHNYLDMIEREDDFNKLSNICCIICSMAKPLDEATFLREIELRLKHGPSICFYEAKDNQIFTSLRRVLRSKMGYTWCSSCIRVVHAEIAFKQSLSMQTWSVVGKIALASSYDFSIVIEMPPWFDFIISSITQGILKMLSKRKRASTSVASITSKNLLKARKVLVEALENAQFQLLEIALIHLETFLPQPKQIDYLDSLTVSILLVLLRGKSYLAFSWSGIFGDAQSIQKAADRMPIRVEKERCRGLPFFGWAKIAKPYSDGTSPPHLKLGHQPRKYRRNSGLQALTNRLPCARPDMEEVLQVLLGLVYGVKIIGSVLYDSTSYSKRKKVI
uniref:Uncharacterized protein n=1 Tax=Salix viminalis TaxID=40686 RepID=A0A6N2N4C3_SALVM